MYKLYVLVDPRTKKIRYVGQTTYSIQERLNQHIRHTNAPSQRKLHVNYWIKSLLQVGLKPIVRLICERRTPEDIDNAERTAISRLKNRGYELCNLTSGGDGRFTMSAATKEKMRQAHLGERNHFYGKTHSEETKKILREKGKGKKVSDERKACLSEIMKGEKNPFYGCKHSDISKRKQGDAKAKTYIFISPNGDETKICNIKRWCGENGLGSAGMFALVAGRLKTYKGWKIKKDPEHSGSLKDINQV